MEPMQESISILFEKYEKMPYMLNRLQHHVTTILPLTLENELSNLEKRIERSIQMSNEQETFIHLFLSKQALFYLTSNNCFYIYNGVKYVSIIEDELNHLILSTITKTGGELLNQCKYKTKMAVIKQIKSRPLWKSIPETETIQFILSFLHPTYFRTKEEAKYFLTILGDNLLKKYSEEEGLYFLAISEKTKLKKMFIEMDMLVFYASGFNNLSNNIVTKYHPSYNYDNCRIIHFNDTFDISLMKPFIIDFLCVSAYHSERYQNSENYILTSGSEIFVEKTLYMKNKNEKLVLNEFVRECIVDINDSCVSWKNLHYVWKMFLTSKNIPNLIYSNVLKEMLKEKFAYNEQTDTFENITSKWLPNIRTFLAFWEETIQVDYSSELELEEIAILFKMYTNNNQTLQEEEILKILNHYFNSTEILDSKYIPHISCKLWDKNNEIVLVLNAFKENFHKKKLKETFITFENVYSFYTKQKPTNTKIHISKRYFEKYMDENLEQHIVIEKCIHKDWISSE
jgi:hypothetical protein